MSDVLDLAAAAWLIGVGAIIAGLLARAWVTADREERLFTACMVGVVAAVVVTAVAAARVAMAL